MKILEVDFNKPWWKIIADQKWFAIVLFFGQLIAIVNNNLGPLVITFAFQEKNIWIFIYFLIYYIIVGIIKDFYIFQYNPIFQLQTINSVYLAASKNLLITDPINHSTRASGKIISKISRGSSAYENFLDEITFSILPLIIRLGLVLVAFVVVDFKLALITSIFFLILSVISIFSFMLNNTVFSKKIIAVDDEFKNIGIENLQQTAYIRSIFATNSQLKKHYKSGIKQAALEGTKWRADAGVSTLNSTLYSVTFGVIGWLIYNLMSAGTITEPIAIGLIATYLLSSSNILSIGNTVKRLSRSHSEILDLFKFVKGYGRQTYPVLDSDKIDFPAK